MKNPRKPTLWQKEMISKSGKNWRNYLVKDDDRIALTLIHKDTGKVEVLFK